MADAGTSTWKLHAYTQPQIIAIVAGKASSLRPIVETVGISGRTVQAIRTQAVSLKTLSADCSLIVVFCAVGNLYETNIANE